jgi:glycosyl transferase family 4
VNGELLVITPELTPTAGGVGDYTIRLLENWHNLTNPRVLVAQPTPPSLPYQVAMLKSDQSSILEQLPFSGGKLLVQYSAYGFDRLGYPAALVHALIDWRGKTGGRLVIMFHEIWTFWPITNKNFFVQFFHRRAIKRLLRCADKVFTSTESQAKHLRRLFPDRAIHVLPVGSNIRRNREPLSSEGQRSRMDVSLARIPGWAVVFGRQSTRIRALKKTQRDLGSLGAAGLITKIISVGTRENSSRDEEERALLAGVQLKEGFEQRGPVPERQVSELLLTASFGVFAQDELSLGKSGTFMAYIAHELNVIADFATGTKPEPICWLVAPQELLRGISAAELKRRAESLLAWQQQISSWELISESFARALDLERTGSVRVGAMNA